jgi:hypothetical protein
MRPELYHPALTSFADEIVGTMARLIPYVVALALLAIIGISLLDQLPDTRAIEPSAKGGWSEATRSAREFTASFVSQDKTEAYGDTPATARACSAGPTPTRGRSPSSKSLVPAAIEAGPAIAEIEARMAPGHARSRLPASPAENSAT